MKIATIILALLFLGLQYKLWFTDGGIVELWELNSAIKEQKMTNQQVAEKNQALTAEVEDLKLGVAALEERARNELGMVKENEIFYQVVDDRQDNANHSVDQ